MSSPYRNPRILFAIPAAVCAGIALHVVVRGVPCASDPDSIVVAYLLGLLAGFLISLLARPQGAASFLLWPLLVFVGLSFPLVLERDSLSDVDASVLLNLLLIASVLIGGALPGPRSSMPHQQSPRSHGIPYLLVISLLSGVNFYWWGLFFAWRFEAWGMLAGFLAFAALFPVLVGWVGFLITRIAGPSRTESFVLWPVLIVAGMFIACMYTAAPLGSDSWDIMIIGPLIAPAFMGSAISAFRFTRKPRANAPPLLP